MPPYVMGFVSNERRKWSLYGKETTGAFEATVKPRSFLAVGPPVGRVTGKMWADRPASTLH